MATILLLERDEISALWIRVCALASGHAVTIAQDVDALQGIYQRPDALIADWALLGRRGVRENARRLGIAAQRLVLLVEPESAKLRLPGCAWKLVRNERRPVFPAEIDAALKAVLT